MLLRNITSADWSAIMAIQAECYHAFEPESQAVMKSKWQMSPNCCFAVELKGKLLGYCLAHPWNSAFPPSLNQLLKQLPESVNTLYIHDIALSYDIQGQGAGKALLMRCKQYAQENQLASLSLVAVQNANDFWLKQGFNPIETVKCLASYGHGASFMKLAI